MESQFVIQEIDSSEEQDTLSLSTERSMNFAGILSKRLKALKAFCPACNSELYLSYGTLWCINHGDIWDDVTLWLRGVEPSNARIRVWPR